ncbi:MAG: sigma-70 family RNA polymerase sigma factor [Planctomycetaceae bacterium]|nr:sigma-70 family RNA polymerase sigma factor [Planctomycetales bacterium]MCB9920779.1 sigma-70 family RNA polymerase sigma factor [Planctomycetaceae bacterium]
MRLYSPLLFSWARNVPLQVDDAADLVQELLVALLRELPKFKYDATKSFRAWLKTVIMNRGRDYLRRQNRGPRVVDPNLLSEQSLDKHDSVLDTDYQQFLIGRALQLMQSEFEESTWRACWECVVHDRPPAEVASQLGMTVNAVYVAKSRVLRHLRRELAGLLE